MGVDINRVNMTVFAIAGGLILGLTESYGIALFGASYRNLFAFVLLIVMLVFKPNGIFARGNEVTPEPLTGTFIARSQPLRIPPAVLAAAVAAAILLPFLNVPYLIQMLTNVLLYALLALSLTLVAGTVGQVSLGHTALLAIGAYASALIGSLIVVGLPEFFRLAADYRVLIYGLALLLLIRFRPQGLLGTV